MTNMVEIGQNNFESSLNKSGDIARRPMDRVKRWLAAAAAGTVLATGAGVAQEARAEEPTPTVDNPTKIEAEVNSSEVSNDGMPQLPEDNLSESTTNTAEGQITAKGGVGDLLANADEGVVTNFKAGVEVPDNNGGEVQYATNVTNESGEAVVAPLSEVETEKTMEQKIAENIVNYLNVAPGYTDEEIKKGLIVLKDEFTDDLGLTHVRNVQGRILGFLKTSDNDNLLVFLGVKDTKKNRFVTPVRIPLYAVLDESCPLKISITRLNGSSWYGGCASTAMVKNEGIIVNALSYGLNKNFVFDLYTSDVSDGDIADSRQYGDTTFRYTNDMKDNSRYIKTLTFSLYRNKIRQKLEYKNPKSPLVKIISNDSDEALKAITECRSKDEIISTIPITLGVHFF